MKYSLPLFTVILIIASSQLHAKKQDESLMDSLMETRQAKAIKNMRKNFLATDRLSNSPEVKNQKSEDASLQSMRYLKD